jgi:hypothetical protein
MSCVALFCGDKRLRVSIASGGGCISFYLLGGRLRGLNATHASPVDGRGGSFSEVVATQIRHTDTPHRYATQIRHTDTPHTRRIQSDSSGAFGSGPWGPSRSSGPSGSGTSVQHQWAHHDSRFTIVNFYFFHTLTNTTRQRTRVVVRATRTQMLHDAIQMQLDFQSAGIHTHIGVESHRASRVKPGPECVRCGPVPSPSNQKQNVPSLGGSTTQPRTRATSFIRSKLGCE